MMASCIDASDRVAAAKNVEATTNTYNYKYSNK